MNPIVLAWVPSGASRQELEAAFQALREALETDENPNGMDPRQPSLVEELPLWTWFLPNPC